MHNVQSPIATVEYWRKTFHLCGLCIPLAYMYLPENVFLRLFFPMAAAFIIIDVARLRIKWLERIYLRVAQNLLRDREYSRPAASLYYLIGSGLTIILFPKQIAIAALAVQTLSDTVAALAGQRLGRHKIGNKTIEGSAAFLISAWIILAVYFGREPLKHLLPALAGTLAELFPSPVDDNLTVPLAIGLSYVILF
ncbi:MAG: SEC59/DGK1/VTE5 family protein [Thermodesulfobacteriota bacterium]|nr:SEC59/DGK1/VTE5 family protein [Thermodesulfobacteriota bacterium]